MTNNEPSAKRVRIQEPELNEIKKFEVKSGSEDEREDEFEIELEGLAVALLFPM